MNALTLVVAAGTLVGSSVLALADAPQAILIPPPAGSIGTVAYGLNQLGTVVGRADDAAGESVGFVYLAGQSVALPLLPGGSGGEAHSINSGNVIVGECNDAGGTSRAVKWEMVDGESWSITDLGTLAPGGVGFGTASRINDAGQIVGYSSSGTGGYHACIWSATGVRDLGTLGFHGNLAYSQGLGINERGEASGFAYGVLQGPEHGLYFSPAGRGESVDITPAGQYGLADWYAINENSMMAGYVRDSRLNPGHFVAARWSAAEGITGIAQLPGTEDAYGYDLNDAGVVVGVMFLALPEPEPSIFYAFKNENGVTSMFDATELQLPGVLVEARAINNAGMVVGTADAGFAWQAVLILPGSNTPPCTADVTGDSVVDGSDFIAFVNSFSTGDVGIDAAADVNADGIIDGDDYVGFINAFAAGC